MPKISLHVSRRLPRFTIDYFRSIHRESYTPGFTLIELVTVMGMLAILMTGIVIAINPQDNLRKASDSVVINDIGALSRGLEAYSASHNGFYPATYSEFRASDEVRISDVPPEGYPAYIYEAYPSGCITGVSCTSVLLAGQLESLKYRSFPFIKFESSTGKICFINTYTSACP